MKLTVVADGGGDRTCRLREVHALAAGDVYSPLVLENVPGRDLATLSMRLYRVSGGAMTAVAESSVFSAVPGHPSRAKGSMTMDSPELDEWRADLLESSDSDVDLDGTGVLVVRDSGKLHVACAVPVALYPAPSGRVPVPLPSGAIPLKTVDDLYGAVKTVVESLGGSVEE